jgi:hypothetical protein
MEDGGSVKQILKYTLKGKRDFRNTLVRLNRLRDLINDTEGKKDNGKGWIILIIRVF